MLHHIRRYSGLAPSTAHEQSEVLRDINDVLVTHRDHFSLFTAVGHALARAVQFDCASLALLDHTGENLSVRALAGREKLKRTFPLRGILRRRGSHLEKVLTEGSPVIRSDLSSEPLIAFERELKEFGLRSYVSVPLLRRNLPFGSVNIGSCSRRQYTEDHLPFLANVANQLALAVDNIIMREEIAALKEQLTDEGNPIQTQIDSNRHPDGIIGESAAIRGVLENVAKAAPTDANIVLTGETGTGKDLIARAIHRHSERSDRPLVVVNCASIPRDLFESEFFGHVKGAFTGALRDRAGRFELAHDGTLFLDEVAEIPSELQAKLLRVLQEGQFERVGDVRTRSVDVRVIAATNRDLAEEVSQGRFREDLFYRLNIYPIGVPPLRERKVDIPLLAAYFVSRAAQRYRRPVPLLTESDVRRLISYNWPGNLREMQAIVDRAVISWREGPLRFDIPVSGERHPRSSSLRRQHDFKILTEQEFRKFERANILAALQKADWKIHGSGGAAELLGVPPTTLASRMVRLELRRPTHSWHST